MQYLGMDVHAKATVWCLLDAQGEVVREGTPTTAPALAALRTALGRGDQPENGSVPWLVHGAA